MNHHPRRVADIDAEFADPAERRAALAENVPPDVADAARALLTMVEGKANANGAVPPSLFRLRRSLAKFIEFADLAG